jgi:cholest-4-en-3-one 26-monooxygenase
VTVQASEIDLTSPDSFVSGVPFEMFRTLRREAPVYRHSDPNGPDYWVVTKHADVVHVSHNNTIFSSEEQGALFRDPENADALQMTRMIMLNMDPPKHTKQRLLVNKGFTPRMVNKLMDSTRQHAKEIVDRVAPKGECDFVTEVAAELPLLVIAELMGIPIEDRARVFEWSNKLIGFDDPEYNSSPEEAAAVSAELYAYANELGVERRKNPRDDIITTLLQAEVDGERLTEFEFDLFFLLLAVAGNETTRNAITHGMHALIENPDQRQRLIDDPELMPTAVEEILRWASPVMHFRRTALEDTEIRGTPIKAGDKIVIWYMSANRDEDVFENPDAFDVGRTPNEHIAFGGGGPHFCLGANLARVEIKVLFEEVLKRLPDMELAGPVRRLRSNFINGVKEMPVRYTPEARRPMRSGSPV